MADHKLTEHYTTQLLTEDEDEKYQQKLFSGKRRVLSYQGSARSLLSIGAMTRTWDAAVVIHNKNTRVTKASTHATMILTLSYRASKGQRHTLDIPGSDGLVFRMEIPSREVFPRAALCHLHTAPAEVRIKFRILF